MGSTSKRQRPDAAFKRQVVSQFLHGTSLADLAADHALTADTVRLWVDECRAELPGKAAASPELLQACQVRIAELERLAGKQALELDCLRDMMRQMHGAANPHDR